MEELDLTNSNLLGEEFSYAKGKKKGFFGKIGAGIKKAGQGISKGVSKAGQGISKGIKKAGEGIKKVTKKLSDKVGQIGKDFRNNFRRILRKGVLRKLKGNAHGYSTRLFPAVATEQELKSGKRKYKASAIAKAKSNYSKLVSKWKDLGGNEAELRSAIKEGGNKRFLKLPFKSASGNNAYEFYSYFAPDVNIYYSSDGESYTYYEGTYSNSDGETTQEMPEQKEQTKGIMAVFAWIKGLFSKDKGGDENPYEAGTPESKEFDQDKKEDAGNEPKESEADNEVIKELEKNKDSDDTGGATDKSAGSDSKEGDGDETAKKADGTDGEKFLGMPKAVGITVVAVGGLALLVGGYFLIKKMRK
jgi:hypothetical protein